MNDDTKDYRTYETNEHLDETVSVDSELKTWLVNYVGNSLNPDNDGVTVEMIVNVMATEFPEFLLAIAEENFFRGYEQALTDLQLSDSDADVDNHVSDT